MHIKNVSKVVFGSLFSLNRHRNFIPFELKSKLVQSLLFPHLYYCDVVFQDLKCELSMKLQRVQNACVRYAGNLKKFDHVSPLYASLKWQKLNVLVDFHLLCIVYNALYEPLFPSYIRSLFITLSDSHGRGTRSADALVLKLPKFSLSVYKKSFVYRSIFLWNSLPLVIRKASSLSKFKSLYRAKYFV